MNLPASLRVLALFFDDVRIELGGKFTLVGQYQDDLYIPPGAPPFDRLAVLLVARWPLDWFPASIAARLVLPRQEPVIQEFPAQSPVQTPEPLTPFAGHNFQAVLHMRFAPLHAGDMIEVWMDFNGHDLPAGRLRIIDDATALGGLPEDAADVPTAPAVSRKRRRTKSSQPASS